MEEVKEQQEEKKVSKKEKIIGNVVFFTLISIMVTFFVWNFIDIQSSYKYPIFGTRTSVIVSPSMATVNDANKDYITSDMKQIQMYDVVTTVNYKSFDEIKIYDIATYYNGSKNLICHRVIDKYEDNGKQYVVFRGDANNLNDTPVSYDLVRGKVVNIVPKVGHVVAFVQSPYFSIAIFGTIFFVALGIFIADRQKNMKKAIAEDEGAAPNEEEIEETASQEENNEPVQEKTEENKQEETPLEEPEKQEEPSYEEDKSEE